VRFSTYFTGHRIVSLKRQILIPVRLPSFTERATAKESGKCLRIVRTIR
jgi:hypothetical protein